MRRRESQNASPSGDGVLTWTQPQSPLRLTVDGEKFEVTTSADQPGRHVFTWLSGPNNGYGFVSQTSNRSWMTTNTMERSIRDFLAAIDPETGYID